MRRLLRRSRHQQGELITAEAGQNVITAAAAAQRFRHAAQNIVPGGMAVSIVEEFEVVQVHDGHRQRVSRTPRAFRLFLVTLVKCPVIEQAGQRVMVGAFQRLRQQSLPLGFQGSCVR